jgi:hypothetical protein
MLWQAILCIPTRLEATKKMKLLKYIKEVFARLESL